MAKKIKHDYKCQVCGKPATVNLQGGGWKLWDINKDGDFDLRKEWAIGEKENSFYCDECYEKDTT